MFDVRTDHRLTAMRASCVRGAVALACALLAATALAGDPDAPVELEIAAQPMQKALRDLAVQADLQILFAADVVRGLEAAALSGRMSAREALSRLLDTTTLEYVIEAEDTIVVRPARAADSTVQHADRPVVIAQADTSQPTRALAGIEEVVVTAQKREQTLQDVPISVLVMSGDTISKERLDKLEDLSVRLPNVSVTPGPASDQLYIRGVGSSINGGFEQSVGTFVDGVYHGRSRYTRGGFVDVERVEVLRGPQSIYFGNNAIGGAFNITTRRPGSEWEGYAQAGWEFEHEELTVEAATGGPITDTFGIRFAGRYSDLDGYIRNLNTGAMNPATEDKFGRIYAVWQPTDDLDIGLKLETGKQDSEAGLAIQLTDCPPASPFAAPGASCNAAMTFSDFEADFDTRRSTNTGERTEIDFDEAMLSVDYALGEHSLTAIAGHTEYDYYLGGDTDTSPAAVIAFSVPEDFEQDSLELRLTSPQGQRLDWIAGAYWQQSDLRYQTDVPIHLLTGLINSNPTFAPLQPYTPIGPSGVLFQDEETRSLFGALTWSFTDSLRATVGLRWTEVDKDARQVAGPSGPMGFYGDGPPLPADVAALGAALTGAIPHDNRVSRKDDDLIPSLNVQYDLNDAVMLYGSFSEGFKAGGFDAFELSGDIGRLSFGPETVDAYEAGFKANWRDAGVSLNLAVFRNEYKDLQQSVSQTGASGIVFFAVSNVGGLVAQGLEVDLIWAIDENWRFNLSGAMLDAEYEDYDNAGCTIVQQLNTPSGQTCTQDLSGQSPPFAPEYSGSVGLEYNRLLAGNLEFFGTLTLSFTDEYDVISDNDPNLRQDAYEKLDARIGVGDADGSWEIAVLGKNLTDEWTSPFGQDAPTSPGSYWRLLDRPRTIALQGWYRW